MTLALPALALALTLLRPAAAQEPGPDELPPLVKEPALVQFVPAPYPESARAAGLEGQVILLLEIDVAGQVTRAEVLQGVGGGLDEAALDAAKSLVFSPAEDAAGPVPVAIEFAYGFVLDSAAAPEATPDADAPPAAEAPVNLDGVLLELGTREPVVGAAIRVTAADGRTFDTTTGPDGRWELRGVPAGTAAVAAAMPGFDRSERAIEVLADQLTTLRLWIRNPNLRDNEVVAVYRKPSADITRRVLTVEEIRRVPGTFGDPVRVIQNLPGAARAPLGTGLLVIRGANPEDSAVYVDGIRIPLIYHLGGYASVINPDLIEAVDYQPGSYGVEYGRSMGGVVDVRTRTRWDERPRLSWNTDLLDTGVFFSTRAGAQDRLGVAAAARRSYIDVFIPIFSPNPDFVVKPRWYDYQLKLAGLDADGTQKDWSFFLFGFQDTLEASTPEGFAQSTDQDTQGDLGTLYGTHRAYFLYERALSDTWSLRAIPSFGLDLVGFRLGDATRINQNQLLAEVRVEAPWQPSEAFRLTPGVDFIGGYYWFDAALPFDPGTLGEFDPLAEREPASFGGRGWGWGPDLYLKADIRPLKERDRLILQPGVRYNRVTISGEDRSQPILQIGAFDPRFAGRFQAVPRGALKGAVGLYHQPPQPFEAWRPTGTVDLSFERALSTELGWEHQLTDALSIDATGFYKSLDDLIVQNPNFTSIDSPFFFNSGIGRIYGGEWLLRHALVDRFFGWISYTLSRSERNDDPNATAEAREFTDGSAVPADNWYRFDFDQTHILTAVAGYTLPRSWEVSGRLQYVTGNPYTPLAGGVYDVDQDFYFSFQSGARNSARLPPFVAVDLRIDKLFTMKWGTFEVFLDLLNAIRGQNPEFTVYNYDYTDSRFIRGLPFIPSPGFQADFRF